MSLLLILLLRASSASFCLLGATGEYMFNSVSAPALCCSSRMALSQPLLSLTLVVLTNTATSVECAVRQRCSRSLSSGWGMDAFSFASEPLLRS